MPQRKEYQRRALLHLNDVWLHFRDVAYPRGTKDDTGVENSTKENMDFICEPDYVISSGIAQKLYGERSTEAESKVTKVLIKLIEKEYVGRRKGQSRQSKKPYYYYITAKGREAIKNAWEEISNKLHLIEDKKLKKMAFGDILSFAYKKQMENPIFLSLLSYFEENEEIERHPIKDILQYLGILQDKIQKTAVVGVRPFTEDESDILFGMNGEIEKLKNIIKDNPWTFLIGASGCGKTSLLRAGLVNQLEEMAVVLVDVKDWKEFKIRMINGPYIDENTKKFLLNKDHSDFLDDFMELQENMSWLLVFDQFEELFSNMTPTKRKEFTLFVQKNLNRRRISFLFSVKNTYSLEYTKWRNEIQDDLDKEDGVKSPRDFPIIIDEKTYKEILDNIETHESHRGSELLIPEQIKKGIINELAEIQDNKKRYGLVYLQIVLKNLMDGRAYGPGSITEWVKDWFSDQLENIDGYSDPLNREILLHLSGKQEKTALNSDDLFTAIKTKLDNVKKDELETTLKYLQREKLVEYRNGEWSLVHDFLAENINEIFSEDERERRRTLHSLKISFEDWRNTDDNRYLLRRYDLDRLNGLPTLSFEPEKWGYIWLSAIQERYFPFDIEKIKEDGILSMLSLIDNKKLGDEDKIYLSKGIIKDIINIRKKKEREHICEVIIKNIKNQSSEVQVAFLAALDKIELPILIRIDMVALLKDKDLTSFARENIVGLLAEQDFDKLIKYLEDDDIPPGVKREIVILAGKLGKVEYIDDILPFLRPMKWQVDRYTHDFTPSTNLEETIVEYEKKLVESAKISLYKLVQKNSINSLIPLLEDDDVKKTHVLYLLGRTRNEKIVPRIVEEIERDHARKAMRLTLEKMLESSSSEVKKILIDMGLKSILEEWENLERMEIEKKLMKISREVSKNVYREESGYNKEIQSVHYMLMSIYSYNNWEIISTGMKALAEIGGKNGTKAFLEIVDKCLKKKYYTGKYDGRDRVIEVLEDMQNIEVNLELEKCLSLLKVATHAWAKDIDHFYRFFYMKGNTTLLPYLKVFIEQLDKEIEESKQLFRDKNKTVDSDDINDFTINESAVKVAKYLFCKLADNKYRKDQIRLLLSYSLWYRHIAQKNELSYYDYKTFFPNLDWNSYIKDIYPLLDDDTVIDESILEYKDEEEYELWRGRRRYLILEIALTINPETIPVSELIVLLKRDIPEDEIKAFLDIITLNFRVFKDQKNLFEELLRLYENIARYRPYLFDPLLFIMFDVSKTNDDARLDPKFEKAETLERFIPVMEDMLRNIERDNFISGLLVLREFGRKGLIPKDRISRLLTEKNVWENIEKALDIRFDIINELLTTYCNREDIWKLSHLIEEAEYPTSLNALKIINQILKKSDYDFLLGYLNSSKSSIRHEIIDSILGLDFNRSVPIVILKYFYELLLIEQKKKRDYKKPSKKHINNMIKQTLIKVKEKREELFSQYISDSDYDTVFNPESLRASFEETGLSHIPYTEYIESLVNAINEVGKRGDLSAVPLLKILLKWFLYDSFIHSKLFSATVVSLRRLDDNETICYLIMDKLIHAPFEGIQAFLDHDMDELFYLKFKDSESNGVQMLLKVIAEHPEYRRKAIRFLSQFKPKDIEPWLRGFDKSLRDLVQKGLEERGCIIDLI